jgi:hypothetical protein
MDPAAPEFIPSASAAASWADGATAPAPTRDARSPEELAQAALQWETTWRLGLRWAAHTLTTTYTPQAREALRGWGLRLESMANGVKERARAGHVAGLEERLVQFDRIWAANQRILLSMGNKDGRPIEQLAEDPAQYAMVLFLHNRNAFFSAYEMGRFDPVRQLPLPDRDQFNGLMDRLETCSDPAVGHDLLHRLDRYSPQVSHAPWRRF